MDYYQIGQKIRKFRKLQGISQEQLAELVGISVTHMSHIETANTKLSLPVFAAIADALHVSANVLLCGDSDPSGYSFDEITEILKSCTPQQIQIITDLVKAAKQSLQQHLQR